MSSIAFYCYLRYYYDDEDVKKDWELRDYLSELSGKYGRVSVERSHSHHFSSLIFSVCFLSAILCP